MKNLLVVVPFLAVLVFMAAGASAWALPLTDLRALYTFDETSGTTFADSGLTGIDATFYRPLKYSELPSIDVSNITMDGFLGPWSDPDNPYIGIGTRPIDTGGGIFVPHQVMVNVPSSTNLPGAGDSFAVSFWLNSASWTNAYGMIASYNLNGLQWNIGIHSSYDAILAFTSDAPTTGTSYAWQASCASLTPSTFNHFVVQFEGTAGITNVYVNAATSSDAGNGNFWGNEHEGFTLGGRVLDARNFTVPDQTPYLDDFAIIDGVVDSTDISNLMTYGASSLGTRLLAHYAMNDTSGTQITDSSANANHGTLIGYEPTTMGPAVRDVATASRPGLFGTSTEFAAGGGVGLAMPEHAEMDAAKVTDLPERGEAFTVCFWLKPDENNASLYRWDTAGSIVNWSNDPTPLSGVGDDTTTPDGLGFSVSTGTEADGSMIVRRTSGNYISSVDQDMYGVYLGAGSASNGLNLDPTVFHHFAVTVDVDGNITGMYVDGTYVASQINNGLGITDEGTAVIGCRIKNAVVDSALSAYLDDLAVISGELTPEQIQFAMEHGVWALFSSIPGDATEDGKVDAADAERVATYWGATVKDPDKTWWQMGDFNASESIDAADAAILAANWGYGVSEGSAVPEPGSIAILLAAFCAVVMVRRR